MPTAHAVATELRKLADSLDRNPDVEIVKPRVNFSCKYLGSEAKDLFLAIAPLLPRPLVKGDGYDHDEYTLTHKTDAIIVHAYIEKSNTCKLVTPAQPAIYDCIQILSPEEDAALTEA